MKYEVMMGEESKQIDISLHDEGYLIAMDNQEWIVQRHEVDGVFNLLLEGKSFDTGLVKHPDCWEVEVAGERHLINVIDPRKKSLRLADGAGEGLLMTQMPGRVVEVCVEAGQSVNKGDVVIIVEAMKMENPLKAMKSGVISKIFVENEQLVEARQQLLLIE